MSTVHPTQPFPSGIDRLNAAVERTRIGLVAAQQPAERAELAMIEADRVLAETHALLEALQDRSELRRGQPSVTAWPRDEEPPPR